MAFATCVATAAERHRSLPADGMVPDPLFTSTHAITIDAPPDHVWPWIAQMGAGRGGWYSWDAIDNGGTPSATRVVPELQAIVPGDVMPAAPGATDAFVVARMEPPRDLVLTAPDGQGGYAVAWEHVLEPLEGGRTRLIARARASSRWVDLARAKPLHGHRRIFIERVYAALARLPRPLLIAFAAAGHRVMEARHLRGIQRRSKRTTENQASVTRWRKLLLTCGILAAVLYVAMTLFVGMLWDGYSAADQTVSELSAIGAPTRPLWMWLGTIYTALMITFGWVNQRAVLAAGGATVTDTLHLAWTIGAGLFFMLETGVGAAVFGKRFRVYSIGTIGTVLACGAITGTYTSRIQANLPTPWAGAWERLNIAAYMGWIATLAIALLRRQHLTPTAGTHRIRT